MTDITRLGIGSAQFGMDYGISNSSGKVLSLQAQRIIREAYLSGCRYVDTAQAYGSAELAIGDFRDVKELKIITKTLPGVKAEDLTLSLRASLEKLNLPSVYGLLVHDTRDLSPAVVKELLIAKDVGLVKKIGVSVYSPMELFTVLKIFTPDIVQIPLNVFDQRFDSIIYAIAEIHVRSVFLQGAVFLASLPEGMKELKPFKDRLDETAKALGVSARRVAIEYVKQKSWITTAVFGVTSLREFLEIRDDWLAPPLAGIDFSRFRVGDENLINPSLWRR